MAELSNIKTLFTRLTMAIKWLNYLTSKHYLQHRNFVIHCIYQLHQNITCKTDNARYIVSTNCIKTLLARPTMRDTLSLPTASKHYLRDRKWIKHCIIINILISKCSYNISYVNVYTSMSIYSCIPVVL